MFRISAAPAAVNCGVRQQSIKQAALPHASRIQRFVNAIKLSVLDLVATKPGEPAGAAIARSVQAARHAERLGYHRYWLAEHHSIDGLACSATPVLIGHIAGSTSTIRVGSGGIMLPNHAPLVVAEQFGTLASLYPDRIDLGLGRAPGSDGHTMRALRGHAGSTGEDFPELLRELQIYLGPPQPGQHVFAIPGRNTNVPITLLGSSDFSARLAGRFGLSFAFAAHFAPGFLTPALALYRQSYAGEGQPYPMAALPIMVAPTDEEAAYLFTTPQQRFLSLVRNGSVELKPPVASMDGLWNSWEKEAVDSRLSEAIVGSPETVRRKLEAFVAATGVEEIFAVTDPYGQADRLRSLDLLAQVAGTVAAPELATSAAR